MIALVALLAITLAVQEADSGPTVRLHAPPDSGDVGGVRFMAFSPDGRSLVTTAERTLCRWNAATGERISQVQLSYILSMDVSPDGTLVAIGEGDDQAFGIFNLETGKQVARVVQEDQARWLKFSPDGRTLAEGG